MPQENDKSTPPPVGGDSLQLTKYEDCVELINSHASDTNVADLQAVLKRLLNFFTKRVGKATAAKPEDSSVAVKRLLAERPEFKRFEPKPIASLPNEVTNPWKS